KDKRQFELLYSKIINKVYFWCYTITGNQADAEDASQEAMLRIYNKIDMLKEAEACNSWMYRVVTNSCYSFLRSKKRKDLEFLHSEDFIEEYEVNLTEERRDALPKETFDLNETKQLIATFVENLPKKQREAITLFYLEEFKIDKIANILSCSSGNVKSQLHNGRKGLEKQVTEYQEKNKVTLYSLSIFPMLPLILKEQRKQLCAKQKFQWNKDILRMGRFQYLFQNMITLFSKNILMILVIVTSIAITSLIFLYSKDSNSDKQAINDYAFPELMMDKEYHWIYEVTYDKNLTQDSVTISIQSYSGIKNTDIKISYADQEIDFTIKDNIITCSASQNGTYEIYIKEEMMDVEINNIDKKAPEILGVYNYSDYIQIAINDEYSTVDYNASYIEYKGKKYTISTDNIVYGSFKGETLIVLYNKEGLSIQHSLEIK
ncbi:MAG: RNA polymerase sigma factor, partial [Coprobacillaceae bacterium]